MAQFYQVLNGGSTFTLEELRAMCPNLQNLQCIDSGNGSIQYIINQDDTAVQYHNQVIGIDQTGATVQLETYQQPLVLDSSLSQQGVYVIEAVDPSAQVAVDVQDQQVITTHGTPQFLVQQLQTPLQSQNESNQVQGRDQQPTSLSQQQQQIQQHSQQPQPPSQQPSQEIQEPRDGQSQTVLYGRSNGNNGITLLDASLQLTNTAAQVTDSENSTHKSLVMAELVHSSPQTFGNVTKFSNESNAQKIQTQLLAPTSQLQGSYVQLSNGQKIPFADWQRLQQQHQELQQQHQQQLQLHRQQDHQQQPLQTQQLQQQQSRQLQQTSQHVQQAASQQIQQVQQLQSLQHQQPQQTELHQQLHPQPQIQLQPQQLQTQQLRQQRQQQLQQTVNQQSQQIQETIRQQLLVSDQALSQQNNQTNQAIQQLNLTGKQSDQVGVITISCQNTNSGTVGVTPLGRQKQSGPQKKRQNKRRPQQSSVQINQQAQLLLQQVQQQQQQQLVQTPQHQLQQQPRQQQPSLQLHHQPQHQHQQHQQIQQQLQQQIQQQELQLQLQQQQSQQPPSQQQQQEQHQQQTLVEGSNEQLIVHPAPRSNQFPAARRTYSKPRIRSHNNLVTNNTVQAIASPTGDQHQNLLQQHETKEVQQPPPRNTTQVVVLLPNGEQRVINFEDNSQGSNVSIKDILSQIGINVDSNVTIATLPEVSNDQTVPTHSKEVVNKSSAVEQQLQNHVMIPGEAMSTPTTGILKPMSDPHGPVFGMISPENTVEEKANPSELPKYVDGMLAICHNCGYTSLDFNRCQRCRKKLPDAVKSFPVADTAKKKVTLTSNEKCGKYMLKIEPEAVKNTKRGRIVRKSRKLVEEPVILTLSSDDEDQRHSDMDSSLDRSISNNHSVLSESSHYVSSDNSVTTSAMCKEPVIYEDKEPGFLTGMENCDGVKGPVKDLDMEGIIDGSVPGQYTLLQCRTVRIGSYKVVPTERVILSSIGMRICVPSIEDETKAVTLSLDIKEVVKVLIHFGRGMPVLFFYAQPAAAARIRNTLKMDVKNGPYYDPTSQDDTQKRITLLPERLHEESKMILKAIFNQYNVLDELNNKEANDILVRASPKEVQNMMKKAIGASTPRPINNEIHTILVYPPHPGKGGIPINTEDYACLKEDQFLNDVIIDFYLRYLTLSVLSEYDQQRTHVFSSFFYKRLTTRPPRSARRSHPVEDDPKLSPAEKRHSRVKSWTKNVNLFEKDFIVIPINEHCHWFLAIICFPGLTSPVRMSDDTPVTEPVNKKYVKLVNKKKIPEVESPPKSLQIGCTTITPVKCTDTITLETGEDGSDRDEAEGEDEDMDRSSDEEEDGGSSEAEKSPSKADSSVNSSQKEESPTKLPKLCKDAIKQPCILIFDSLAGASRTRVVATLRDYLRIENKAKGGKERDFSKDTIRGASPKVPQQTNFTDCGLYLLQYVESFFKDPIQDYRLPMRVLANWFPEEVVNRKREELHKLLLSLIEKTGVDPSSLNLPKLSFSSHQTTPPQDSCEKTGSSNGEEADLSTQGDESFHTEASTEEETLTNNLPGRQDGVQISSSGSSSTCGVGVLVNSSSDPNCVKKEKVTLVNYSDDSDEKNSMSVDSDTSSPVDMKKSNTLSYLKSKRIERHVNKDIDRTPSKKMRTDNTSQDNR